MDETKKGYVLALAESSRFYIPGACGGLYPGNQRTIPRHGDVLRERLGGK